MFRKAKLIVDHAKMFVWMSRHAIKAGAAQGNLICDFVEDDTTITTVCRCLHCGETFQFSSKKSQK